MQAYAFDCYFGMEGPEDLNEARRWFERALTVDRSSALEVALGHCLVHGLGGPIDELRALNLLRPHIRTQAQAAADFAQAARKLASQGAAHVLALLPVEDLDEDERRLLSANRLYLARYPEALTALPRAPMQIPTDPRALLTYLMELVERRPTNAEHSPPERTRYWVDQLLSLAAAHFGVSWPSIEPTFSDPAADALQGWFDQRKREVGGIPGFLPRPDLSKSKVAKLDRLRTMSVLLEPREPHSDTAVWMGSNGESLARDPSVDTIRAALTRVADPTTLVSIPLLLEGLAQLPQWTQRKLLPAVLELPHSCHARVLEIALQCDDDVSIHALLKAGIPLASRARAVHLLRQAGRVEEATALHQLRLRPRDGTLVVRTIEAELMRVAMGGARSMVAFDGCVAAVDTDDLRTLRRLALVAARAHPRPLEALAGLAERIVPLEDPSAFHTLGAWTVLGRVDLLAAALVEWQTGRPMDGPQR